MVSSSPTDIITFVGIPLAVLGAIPILFTCIKALFTLRSIQRTLHHNGLTAVTRGSFLSGIIEIELPRFSITPLDRDDPAYWKTPSPVSHIRGGTWTLFHWDRLATGHSLYRLQYHDELRQPQAEVDFEELVAFLLDRGAVPSRDGFRMLRTSGLWTPTGTRLLLSPDTCHSVLKVAPADDSDGSLSVSLKWDTAWDGKRGVDSLPPYWMRIDAPDATDESKGTDEKKGNEDDKEESLLVDDKVATDETQPTETLARDPSSESEERLSTEKRPFTEQSLSTAVPTPPPSSSASKPTTSLRFRINSHGIQSATTEHAHIPTATKPPLTHLRSPSHTAPSPSTIWFASAATSLFGHQNMGLSGYAIPPAITSFVAKDSMPVGVLCLLSIIAEADAPAWASPVIDHSREIRFEQFCASSRIAMEENRLPPAQAQAARARRQAEESAQFFARCQAERREAADREEKRFSEALRSSCVDNKVAGEAWLKWLVGKGCVREGEGVRRVVERVLWKMVFDEAYCGVMVGLLEMWRVWADGGGMSRQQFREVEGKQEVFAEASCLVWLLKEGCIGAGVGQGEEGGASAARDMQETMRVWSKVRIG